MISPDVIWLTALIQLKKQRLNSANFWNVRNFFNFLLLVVLRDLFRCDCPGAVSGKKRKIFA
jgi:hypothetical protein